MTRYELPFAQIAAAALARAEQLLAQWLPDGKREVNEWKALNPIRGDRHVGSFSVNIDSGYWGDFATNEVGGDLISLYAYLFEGGDQGAAARAVAELVGIEVPPLRGDGGKAKQSRPEIPLNETGRVEPDSEPEKKPKKESPWVATLDVPADAPPPPAAHEFRGRPEAMWTYRSAAGLPIGFIYRFTKSEGGKEIVPLAWCVHQKTGKGTWRWVSFPKPRPLYGLDRLAAKPDAPLLIVEGEKCADAAHEHLPEYAVASWPGGGKAVDLADWMTGLIDRPLKRAILWPDCDAQRDKKTQELLPDEKQPGIRAMRAVAAKLAAIGFETFIVDLPPAGSVAEGWDIADALAEGWDDARLQAFVAGAGLYVPPDPDAPDVARRAAAKTAPDATQAPAEGREYARPFVPDLIWGKNGLSACLSNVYQVLTTVPEWRGVIAFDEFAQRTVKRRPPPYEGGVEGEWDAMDDTRTAIWLAQFCIDWKFTPSSLTVGEAIEVVARENAFHPVRDWLEALPEWDGVKRLPHWLTTYLGVPESDYTKRVGTWFLMGLVARVMNPGCKFDYCLVLEGPQGKGKSTALKNLGGEWYADTDLDLHNKDSMSALRGKWLYEFAELGSVARAESLKQKSFLSRQVDEFRPVYGRREIKCPRQVVFAGSTNEWEWNKDPTGGRRFWPAETGEIDHELLAVDREQLFAEALRRYKAGQRYWPTPAEQRDLFDPEQLKVEIQESLVDGLHDWVYKRREAIPPEFSMYDVMSECLKLDASKMTRDMQTRVGSALRKLGCKKQERKNGMVRFVYKPPEEGTASSQPDMQAQQEGAIDVGF